MNKLWDVDMVGVLATEDYVRQKTGKACVFINNQNAVQFSVRLISETPGNFPNRDLFTGFSTNLESYAFEDRTWEPDAVRKEALVNFLEDKLMVFRPQQKTRRDGDDVYQMTEVRLKSKTDAFQESTTFVPVPVFCAGRHARDEAEFVEKLRARRYVGRIEHISTELHDTPAQVLFKDPLGAYTVHGVFDKHLFANGGFSF
ncbi:MAG: hypothetical protein OWU32_13265, partial [Firmicutes bacterium]|nr:hypothetical protein [Bacillota bacterium]